MLPYLADAIVGKVGWELLFTVGMGAGTQRPLLILSPILAETLAKAGLVRPAEAASLRARAHPGREVRALRRRVDQFVPGRPTLAEIVKAGQIPGYSPSPTIRTGWCRGLPRGRHHDRGERRSAAHQRLRVRAQRHAGLSHDEADPPARGVATRSARSPRASLAERLAVDALWVLLPPGQRASGEWIDDTLRQRAEEKGLLAAARARVSSRGSAWS